MVKKQIREYLLHFPEILEMHGLYLDEEEKTLRLDIIIDFNAQDRLSLYNKIKAEIAEMFPDYKTFIQLDLDVSTL